MCLCCAIDRKPNISMSHTLECTLLHRAFYQPLFSRRPIIRLTSETLASRDDRPWFNALLFLGNHHQTPRQDSECQEGREKKADDERENPREGAFHNMNISKTIFSYNWKIEEIYASRRNQYANVKKFDKKIRCKNSIRRELLSSCPDEPVGSRVPTYFSSTERQNQPYNRYEE